MPTAARPLVILVDDDEALRSALKFSLELDGYDVATCSSGEDLLDQHLPGGHACLVIDERLPGIAGLDALAQLRRRNVHLPALLITSTPRPALRRKAAAAGVPIVEKPLLCDALSASIREALGTST
jgi:FixJ family two-component response regulator